MLASAWPYLPACSKGKLLKCSHVCAQLPDFALCSTTPTGYILEAPELGTPCCNLLVLVVSAIKGFQCTHMQIQVAENFHGLLSMNATQHSPCKNTNCMVHWTHVSVPLIITGLDQCIKLVDMFCTKNRFHFQSITENTTFTHKDWFWPVQINDHNTIACEISSVGIVDIAWIIKCNWIVNLLYWLVDHWYVYICTLVFTVSAKAISPGYKPCR